MIDKAKLRELLEKATPGPWWWHSSEKWFGHGPRNVCDGGILLSAELEWEDGDVTLDVKEDDAELLVTARNSLPSLLDDLDAKDQEIARLTARCAAMERAIRGAVPLERMIHVTKPCAGCKHHDTNIPVGECALPTGYYDCVGHPDYPETHCQYEFDEARFAAKGGKPCC